MHTIHLRHPWQCEPHGQGCCWLRSFNWPAGLSSREVAWLVVEPCPVSAVVSLSGKPLISDEIGRFDISPLLAEYNQLTIELNDSAPTDDTECPLDVRLEISEE